MHPKRLLTYLALLALALLSALALAACDPSQPPPTPSPAAPSPTPAPSVTPSITPTPSPTHTPTVTPTPTETPQPTVVSIPSPQPPTLVQRELEEARRQYEEALARWQAQNVVRYELVVRHNSTAPFAGTWELLVTPDNVEVNRYWKLDVLTPTTAPDFMRGEALRFLTVEGLFASIDFRLKEAFGSALEARADYVATFDAELGYPVSVEIKPRSGRGDLASSTVVGQVKVLHRSAPVAPTPTPTVTSTPGAPTEGTPASLTPGLTTATPAPSAPSPGAPSTSPTPSPLPSPTPSASVQR